MKSIIALQDMIKQEEKRSTILKRQLSDHESGINKLTILQKSSTETSLENTNQNLEIHRKMLEQLTAADLQELEEKERIEEAIKKRNYYKYQKVRLKRDLVRSNDTKLEAMYILDELPEEIEFEDNELFELAQKSIELDLSLHEQLEKEFQAIKKDFNTLLKECNEEDIKELAILNSQIPIVVLHFYVLLSNIKANREIDKLPPISGFPKFEDWWIDELWYNHKAYFGLYKFKSIVKKMCTTKEQEVTWDNVFNNWIFIKKLINNKGLLGFKYNFAFDSLMVKYGEFEEELDIKNLKSMEKIIDKLIKKADLEKTKKKHNINTSYLQYKIKRMSESN
ncbi:MAG: hypothetical protein U9Q20_07980 [Campylobacterota bacterium]|nr:hypothetical protein [Campylobacterota bacterium]